MPVAVALLRGINLLKHKRIKMDQLRALHESLGFRDVETYIQSGNVVFTLKTTQLKKAAARIEAAIEEQCGFSAPVTLRTADDLRQALAANPFAGRKDVEHAKLLIGFLGAEPSSDCAQKLAAIKVVREEIHQVGRELFIHFADGVGNSKVSTAQLDRAAGVFCTARNLNTVLKLLELAEAKERAR